MIEIKNILCDMGNVLVDFTPIRFCAEVSDDYEKVQHLAYNIFYTQAWLHLDEGIISEDEALFEILLKFELEDHELVKKIFYSWDEWMHEKEGMNEIITSLKEKGYRLLIASNASLRYHHYIHRLKIFNLFDELIYSCDLKCVKPNPEFFKYILQHKNITAEETLFIDDSLENCKSAQNLGFQTYHFIGDVLSFKESLIKNKIL